MARGARRRVSAADVGAVMPPVVTPNFDTRPPIEGYGEYEIDIEAVLRENLPVFFEGLDAQPLTLANVEAIPPGAKGAYMLFKGENPIPVYAGKTDSDHGFQDRLKRHAWTVRGRRGLDPGEMRFKAVRIMVFAALDVEALLIRQMKATMPGALGWNNSGFGSNDPGKARDGQEPADFDQWFPIDYDYEVTGLPAGDIPVHVLLRMIKNRLPFLLRHAPAFTRSPIRDVPERATLRELMAMVMAALPHGWQSTVLHGRVILYPKHVDYEFYQEMDRT